MKPHGEEADQVVLDHLIASIGERPERLTIRALSGIGAVNAHYLITVADTDRYVARIYRWPFGFERRVDRRTKESLVLARLEQASVPAPRVIATVDSPGEGGVLLSFLSGELLGEVMGSLSDSEQHDAWRAVGRALRSVHCIRIVDEDVSILQSGGPTARPARSWSEWHREDIQELAWRFALESDPKAVEHAPLQELLDTAKPLMDQSAMALLHADAHPWNVLVDRDEAGEWKCTGWIDWEWAWIGDPQYDLMRNEVMRFRDIGPTPQAFYDGYGASRTAIGALYELGFQLLLAVDGPSVPGLGRLVERAQRFLRPFYKRVAATLAEVSRDAAD